MTSSQSVGIVVPRKAQFAQPIRLRSGAVLDQYELAYETYGELNKDRSNAILVCHALTGDQFLTGEHPITGKPGWWEQMVGPGKPKVEVTPKDGDILWKYDMMDELGVFPHNASNCSVIVLDDKVFVCTSNGQDWTHVNIPSPNSPSFICLDAQTGKLLATDTLYPFQPKNDVRGAQATLLRLITQHGVELIAIGNGFSTKRVPSRDVPQLQHTT